MTTLLILLILVFLVEKKWKPRISFIDESQMWLLYYNYRTTRKYLVLWK